MGLQKALQGASAGGHIHAPKAPTRSRLQGLLGPLESRYRT